MVFISGLSIGFSVFIYKELRKLKYEYANFKQTINKLSKTLSKIEEVSVLEFENTDIVRNKIVSKILEIFPDK